MQVAQVNSSVATALGQSQADEVASRADDFARVLRTAVYGKGSQAVAKTTERAITAAVPRTETRALEPRARAEQPATRATGTQRKDAARDAAAQKPADARTPAKTEAQKPGKSSVADQPAKTEAPAKTTKPAGKQQAAQDTETDSAEEIIEDAADKLVVADAPDAALILALLQMQVVPDEAVAAPVAEAAVAAPVPDMPVSPEEAAAAALAATAEAQTKAATPVPADAAADLPEELAKAAAPVAPLPLAADPQIRTTTDTSAAALLSQQQTVSTEDFAAIQQALTAQNQGQVQEQTGKPVVTAEAKQKAEPKAEKFLTVDVQTATAAPKTLVDQAALFVMQEDDPDADAALLQQQAQAAPQPAIPDVKFNAALLQTAADDVALTGGTTGSSNSGQSLQQTAAIGATSATQATQSAHQTTQTAARHLAAYVPVGEQVGVQIRKGVAEGLDKISIKLDPGNLGKVEIKLEIGHDGRLQAVIAADKPETLQLLQQDVKHLEQSLRDSGLKTDQQSLSFQLRDQNEAGEGRNGEGNGRQRNRGGEEYAETGATTDPAQLAAANAQRAAAARGGLDLRI